MFYARTKELEQINNYLEKAQYGFPRSPVVKVVPAKLGYDSGKIGAACLFFN